MFLDSGTIISDETFYTQSQKMVEKVPEVSAESLCLRQGMVTSYHRRMFPLVECFVTNKWLLLETKLFLYKKCIVYMYADVGYGLSHVTYTRSFTIHVALCS